MTETNWWDTVDPELVKDLMHRQHPFHDPRRPKVECNECKELMEIKKEARRLRPPPPNNTPYISSKSNEPMMKRIAKRMQYWVDEP